MVMQTSRTVIGWLGSIGFSFLTDIVQTSNLREVTSFQHVSVSVTKCTSKLVVEKSGEETQHGGM